MMTTADGLRVAGTLRTVRVEDLQPEDLIIKGHALRQVVRLGRMYLDYQQVHVQLPDEPGTQSYWTWEFLPGTPVLILRPDLQHD